jgi:hypothetical protein
MVQSALSTKLIWTGDLAGLARVSYLHFGGLHIPCYHSSNVDNVTVGPERGDTCGGSDIGILLIGRRDLYAYDGGVSSGLSQVVSQKFRPQHPGMPAYSFHVQVMLYGKDTSIVSSGAGFVM